MANSGKLSFNIEEIYRHTESRRMQMVSSTNRPRRELQRMDEGIRLDALQVHDFLLKRSCSIDWFYRVFSTESDGGFVWIHNVVRKDDDGVTYFLKHFGYGIDLRPLTEEKKINMDFRDGISCDSCVKNGCAVHAGRSFGFSLCYTCLSEMVIFYEMEKEKRDSGAKKVQEALQLTGPDYLLYTNKGVVWDKGIS